MTDKLKYTRVLRAAAAAAWAIKPDRLADIIDVLAFQASGGKLTAAEIAEYCSLENRRLTPLPVGALGELGAVGMVHNDAGEPIIRLTPYELLGNVNAAAVAAMAEYWLIPRAVELGFDAPIYDYTDAIAAVSSNMATPETLNARRAEAIERENGKRAGVAVLSLRGIIAHRAEQVNNISGPGGTSTELFGKRLDDAINNSQVDRVLIDVDSPGGTVDGVPELAAKIYQANKQKPITAIANTGALSAAYYLASQAGELVVTPSGEVGSIGVFTAHSDISAALEKVGEKITLISAGRYKTEGNPFEPLSDDARGAIQKRIDAAYNDFTAAVARGRGVPVSDVRKGYGEGRTVAAKEALKLGMVDRIATFEQTLDRLRRTPAPAIRQQRAALARRRMALNFI